MQSADIPSESPRPTSPATRPPLELVAGSIAAVFTFTGDRWLHRILDRHTGAAHCESVEGPWPPDGDPRWPASPALVELSRVELPRSGSAGGLAIVGVGLAGRSHFSASIAADQQMPDTIRFEIACRLHEQHEPPAWLGSTYRAGSRLNGIAATAAGLSVPRTVVWSYSIGPQGIVAVSGATVADLPG